MDEPSATTRVDGGATPVGPSDDLPDQLLKGRLYEQLFPSVPRPSARLGRFALLRELGRGGMGVVLSAYDEQLDRKVAIKLLHADVSRDEGARARLLREAQALARLSHPNVVQVHEAGVHEGQVYLVMEYVEGPTLREWVAEHAPSSARARWRVVLEKMVAAGEGLAAAHEAGLMHRDFKPDNVLVGTDGRVRVADFGLAADAEFDEANRLARTQVDGEGAQELGDSSTSEPARRPLERVTLAGSAVGTVAYMPLEQLRGEGDARSDQFSFCVTLYEALFGQRPFGGASRAAVELVLEQGEPKAPTEAGAVPKWLRRAVWRGLQRDPEQRFEDMRGLLQALQRRARWSRWSLPAAALGALGVIVTLATAGGVSPCGGMDALEVPGWSTERRATVEHSWLASDVPHAAVAWPYMMHVLDTHAQAWRDTRRRACEATHVEESASPGDEQRTEACLDRVGRQLNALTERLGEAEAIASPQTPLAVQALPLPGDCAHAGALLRGPTPSEAERVEVIEVERLLARVRALGDTGAVRQGLTSIETAVQRARELSHAPTQAETLRLRGGLRRQVGGIEGAERDLLEGLELAEGVGADQLAFDVLLELVMLAVDRDLQRSGRSWLTLARAKLARIGEDPHRLTLLMTQQGLVAYAGKDYEAAASAHRVALEAHISRGDDALQIARARNNLANALEGAGRREEAEQQRTLALDLMVPRLGAHPQVAAMYYNLAVQQLDDGRLEPARQNLEHALTIFEAHGNDLRIADCHVVLAQRARSSGRLDQAADHARKAASAARAHPDDHALWAAIISLQATLHQDHGDCESAIPGYEAAIEQILQQEQSDPMLIAAYGINIGECALSLGRIDAARERFEAAVEADVPDDWLALPLRGLGEIWLRQGEPSQALPLLERALELRVRMPGNQQNLAEIRWSLARAYAQLGEPNDRVEGLAREALADFAGLGDAGRAHAAEIEAWLRQRTSESSSVPEPDRPRHEPARQQRAFGRTQ